MGPLDDDSEWGNSNPDVFADSSGYRGFRLRLDSRSVDGQAPSPCPPIIEAVEVSGGEVPLWSPPLPAVGTPDKGRRDE